METLPKIGMSYKQSVKRGERFIKEGNMKMAESIANQVRLNEGERASNEFKKEIYSKGKQASTRRYFS